MVVLIIVAVQRVPSSMEAWVVGVVSPRWSTLIQWMSGLGWWSRIHNDAMYQEVVVSIPRPAVVGRFSSGEETPTVVPSKPVYLRWAFHQLGPLPQEGRSSKLNV